MCGQFVSIREYFQGRRAKPRGDARFISLLEGLLTYLDLGFSRGARSRLCSTNKRIASDPQIGRCSIVLALVDERGRARPGDGWPRGGMVEGLVGSQSMCLEG
jgi:hypothetical protein